MKGVKTAKRVAMVLKAFVDNEARKSSAQEQQKEI